MELVNNRYTIGGVAIDDIVALAGTPVYVYDAAIIERQVRRLQKAFSGIDFRLMYACKALSNMSILRLVRRLGTGLDTVSLQEVHLGLHAGFTPDEILYTPNMVSFEEIRQAAELGVHINIDTISVLEHFGHEFGGKIPVCIRINPHIMAGGNERISTGHIDSKFGISIHQMRHVQRVVATYGMRVNGLHMHTGSDILDADVFLQGADILLEIAESFPDVEFLDFGSGFKVPYKPDDIATDIDHLGSKLSARINEVNARRSKPLQIWFEPGKFIVSESGTFLATVNVVKQTTATVFAGVNTGLNHLIRPMLYNAYHHIVNVSNPGGPPRIYTVVGYICETDTFGWDRKLHEVREGDVLAFQNAGAYGMTMASNYNSRLRPAEVLVEDGVARLIRRRETLDDLLQTQTEA
ncbi:MAG TPA: diaminopimelate decarboxylase [Bacteroidetes bacterium]|nr:diaminopimelate decarboxylase [Bacteroidota bacterium]HRK04565.1 diaminopimelate decarboxylase [Chlorobiota bacterium]